MSDIPNLIRHQVIGEVYRQADTLGWDSLSMVERTAQYNLWLDDDQVGVVLTRFMPRERTRMWLKDVPMKHYNRARSGIGPYAGLVRTPLPSAVQIAAQALGKAAVVIDGSVREKPNRCRVLLGPSELLMFWDKVRNLQNLVWAGLNTLVDEGSSPVLVLTLLQGEKLSDNERRRHQEICRRAGLEVRHVTVR
ncbi:hypothetical protein ACFWG6_07005 [Streptomyces erythrochromogenes]|uniref:hypothetical protein n=1 Tax=Streptomyces erythrochromogenes TaxID=285574 RepID=UPI0036319459